MQVQSCCLLISPERIIFCPSPCRRRRCWFCCNPEIVLPWLRDVTLLLSIDQNMDVHYQVKHGLQSSTLATVESLTFYIGFPVVQTDGPTVM